MRTIIAYGLLVFGAPIAIGSIVILVVYVILEFLIGETWKKIPSLIEEAVEGAINMIMALLLFQVFRVNVSIMVPLILVGVTALWLSTRKEYKAILWQLIGIGGVWLIYVSYFT